MIACYKGHIRIAKYLLKLKASVNRKSVKGNTALHDCAESGSLEVLKLLIEHGGTMDVDSYGTTYIVNRISFFFVPLNFIGCFFFHAVIYFRRHDTIVGCSGDRS